MHYHVGREVDPNQMDGDRQWDIATRGNEEYYNPSTGTYV